MHKSIASSLFHEIRFLQWCFQNKQNSLASAALSNTTQWNEAENK